MAFTARSKLLAPRSSAFACGIRFAALLQVFFVLSVSLHAAAQTDDDALDEALEGSDAMRLRRLQELVMAAPEYAKKEDKLMLRFGKRGGSGTDMLMRFGRGPPPDASMLRFGRDRSDTMLRFGRNLPQTVGDGSERRIRGGANEKDFLMRFGRSRHQDAALRFG